MIKTWLSITFLFFFAAISAQKIAPENLSGKVKVYWDANKKFVHSTGSYYVDDRENITIEKHGTAL